MTIDEIKTIINNYQDRKLSGEMIIDMYMAVYGFLPILQINEEFLDQPEWEEYFTRKILDQIDIDIDISKLKDFDTYRLRYVENIIISPIEVAVNCNDLNRRNFHVTTSHKYSFCDTSDWWSEIQANDISNREIFTLYVEVNN